MDDENIADRLRRRFQLFGQFFKGFVNPVQSRVSEDVRADQQVYDDIRKFGDRGGILEFKKPPSERDFNNDRQQSPLERRSFSGSMGSFDIFGGTRSLLEEFEQTMKIFDDFAFIIQHPMLGEGDGRLPPGVIPDEEINPEGDDEQDNRYFKFFGRGLPGGSSSDVNSDEDPGKSAASSAEENCRDLMLKPSPGTGRPRDDRDSLGDSLLGRILDSIWDMRTMDPSNTFSGSPNSDNNSNNSYFTFTSQESSLRSDGIGVSVTATKIRETPDGREVITYQTNADGVTEETREFIPRKDIPKASPPPIIGGIFRPRL